MPGQILSANADMNINQLIDILEQRKKETPLETLRVHLSTVLQWDHDDHPLEIVHKKLVSIALDDESQHKETTLVCAPIEPGQNADGITAAELLMLCSSANSGLRELKLFAGVIRCINEEYEWRTDAPIIGHGVDSDEGHFMLLIDSPPEEFDMLDQVVEQLVEQL